MVPIPAFDRTFSSGTLTRGLYFQAPADLTIVGVRVPDESSHGKQNVCVYRHSSAPPAFSSSVALTPRFKSFGAPSSQVLPCAVSYKKGEWVIVLGACGDSTTMRNSYGKPSGPFASTVLGSSVNLMRCGVQSNIAGTAAPHKIWSENSGPVSRVEIYVIPGLAPSEMIPLPAFNRTFSSSMTRGFYTQAPTPFTVVGVRVPDEAKHGKQNVCLYRNASAPPAFSSTVSLSPVFKKFGEPSANIIPCLVPYNKGDWLITLGACGDSTGLKNSYGPTKCAPSAILGQSVSLCRALAQVNIVTAATPHKISSENSFEIGRVELFVSRAGLMGAGTGAVGGSKTFYLASPADGGQPYQMASSFGDGPLWIDSRMLGLTPDSLFFLSVLNLAPATFYQYAGALSSTGAAKAALVIPKIPALKGIGIETAYVTLGKAAPSGISSISNVVGFVIQ
jgi:hypothetical protein